MMIAPRSRLQNTSQSYAYTFSTSTNHQVGPNHQVKPSPNVYKLTYVLTQAIMSRSWLRLSNNFLPWFIYARSCSFDRTTSSLLFFLSPFLFPTTTTTRASARSLSASFLASIDLTHFQFVIVFLLTYYVYKLFCRIFRLVSMFFLCFFVFFCFAHMFFVFFRLLTVVF